MIETLRKKFFNRMFLHQLFFYINSNIFKKKNIKDLLKNGYLVFDKKFTFDKLNFDKYLNYTDYNLLQIAKK